MPFYLFTGRYTSEATRGMIDKLEDRTEASGALIAEFGGRIDRYFMALGDLEFVLVAEWAGREARGREGRPDEPVVGHTRVAGQELPVPRFAGFPPSAEASGEIEAMALYAGQGVGLVSEVRPAGAIVRELAEGARRIIAERLGGCVAAAEGPGGRGPAGPAG